MLRLTRVARLARLANKWRALQDVSGLGDPLAVLQK